VRDSWLVQRSGWMEEWRNATPPLSVPMAETHAENRAAMCVCRRLFRWVGSLLGFMVKRRRPIRNLVARNRGWPSHWLVHGVPCRNRHSPLLMRHDHPPAIPSALVVHHHANRRRGVPRWAGLTNHVRSFHELMGD
jgi:hypothetical protein